MKLFFIKPTFITLLLSASCALAADALNSTYYKTNSVLSQGHWVKIRISENGIQEIPFDKLREWGFSDPSKVTVYGYGGDYHQRDITDNEIFDDLPQQYSIIDNDRILFYGKSGIDATIKLSGRQYYAMPARNFASDNGYYFLTDSRQRETKKEIPYVENSYKVIDTHSAISVFEEELTNPSSSGQHFFGRDFSRDKDLTVEFDIKDPADNEVYTQSYWVATANAYQTVKVEYYGGSGDISVSPTSTTSPSFRIPDDKTYFTVSSINGTCKLPTGSTKFKVVAIPQGTAAFSYLANDYISLRYMRNNRLSDDEAELPMTFINIPNESPVAVKTSGNDIQVWNNNFSSDIRPYQTVYNEEDGVVLFSFATTRMVASTDNRAIAFRPSAKHHEVSFEGIVENQNLHAIKSPELLIISSDICHEQALRLADLHRTRLGQTVEVVRQGDIFNEFSSGAPTPVAYRRFAKMLYDRRPATFRHILLFGGGSYDNRGIMSQSNQAALIKEGALLMTYPIEDRSLMGTKTKSYTTDAYFGFLADNCKPENIDLQQMLVNVGRIPATSASKAKAAVDKIERYLSYIPATDVANRAIVMTDCGNRDLHLRDGEAISGVIGKNNPGSTIVKIYQALYEWTPETAAGEPVVARSIIKKTFQQGVGAFIYFGHGGPGQLATQNLWTINHMLETQNSYYPVGMLGSCDTYTYDQLSRNFVEETVLQSNGGMINIIGACRTVYQDRNRVLGLNVADAYSSADETTLSGDIFRIGRNKTIDSYSATTSTAKDGRINTLCYNMCGDPALPLYQAADKISLSSINDEAYSSDKKYQLKSFDKNTIEGIIADASGAVDPDFNGSVIVTVHESPVQRKTISHKIGSADDRDTANRVIDTDFDVLMQTIAKVENGRFKAEIYPSAISRQGDYNRITFFAYTPDRKDLAKGSTTATYLTLQDAATARKADTEAPVISEFYINAPTFRDGDCVDGNFDICGVITDDKSGISMTSSSLGSGSYIMIDENRRINVNGSMMTADDGGTIRFSVPVDMITDGRHTATLHVSDNAGNNTVSEISFYVINTSSAAALSVEELPARTEANFSLTHNFPDTPEGRLIIEDNSGNAVFVKDSFDGTFCWDLFDKEKRPVADGIYRARAMMRCGMKFAETPEIEFIVLQKQ